MVPPDAVRRFQHLTFSDAVLRQYLNTSNQPQLAARQAAFLTAAYQGRQFDAALAASRAYHGLGLAPAHTQRIGEHACTVLRELGADEAVVSGVWEVLGVVHEDVAGSGQRPAAEPPIPVALPVVARRRLRRPNGLLG